jgi:DNA end-binding protein Ku
VIDDEDIKKITPKTAKVNGDSEFVPDAELDAVYLDSSYYLQPDEAGEKAYTLLYKAMKDSGHFGIAKITMHNREHVVVHRPGKHGILLHTSSIRTRCAPPTSSEPTPTSCRTKNTPWRRVIVMALAGHFERRNIRTTYRDTLPQHDRRQDQGQ